MRRWRPDWYGLDHDLIRAPDGTLFTLVVKRIRDKPLWYEGVRWDPQVRDWVRIGSGAHDKREAKDLVVEYIRAGHMEAVA